MNKKILKIPANIEYISDWEDYKIEDFPHILDKQVPGCGYTEYCIRNDQNIILCSPRKILLKNKAKQHPGEVFLVRYLLDEPEVDIDISKLSKIDGNFRQNINITSNIRFYKKEFKLREQEKKNREKLAEQLKQEHEELRQGILNYCQERKMGNKPYKILVTYDSFRKVKALLKDLGILEEFHIVVDEFQSIFTDSYFKSETENEFLTQLRDLKKVCYVSATPIMENYLDQIDEFKNLPYYEFDWISEDPSRLIRPVIDIHTLQSITSVASDIISSYRKGKGVCELSYDPETGEQKYVQSKEAVFYVNSVENIIRIIRNTNLQPEEVNILCADTENNRKRIQMKLGKDFTIGEVPLRAEPRKMFTFCTRTVYLGADFYSDNARSFVFSDANINTLTVDIRLDLPQILGRQRLASNPWKNKITVYVNPLFKNNEVPKDEFNRVLKEKKDYTNSILMACENINLEEQKKNFTKVMKKLCEYSKYKYCYVSADKLISPNDTKSVDFELKFNNLVFLSEKRAFEIQQSDYKNMFYVKNALNTAFKSGLQFSEVERISEEILSQVNKLPRFYEMMKYVCERLVKESPEVRERVLDQVPRYVRTFYLTVGPERCKALSYNYGRIYNEFNNMILVDQAKVDDMILASFKVGDFYDGKEIKKILLEIYNKANLKKTPKINDLEDTFIILRTTITKDDGSHVQGYKIIALKP